VTPGSITALILAGGRATRLGGVDKAELVVDPADGRTIFERQVEVLAPRVAEVVVSSPRPVPGYRTVADAIVDGGPLAGIAAGLAAATTPWVLIVAGDMPALRGDVIELLWSGAEAAIEAVAFRVAGLPEPLLCLLSRAPALAAVERLLAAGTRKASRLLTDAGLSVAWIEEADLRAIDPKLRSLANVNEPGDLGDRGFSPGSRSGTN